MFTILTGMLWVIWVISRLTLGAFMDQNDIPEDFKGKWPNLILLTIREAKFTNSFIISGRYKDQDIKPSTTTKTRIYIYSTIIFFVYLLFNFLYIVSKN